MAARIISVGTALPAHVLPQREAGRLLATHSSRPQVVESLFARSGILERHSCLNFFDLPDADYLRPTAVSTAQRMARYHDEALPLASRAARDALSKAQRTANDITHLVTISCTGFSAPGFDCGLVEELGIERSVFRTHIGFMGCHGAFNGLRVARSFCYDNPRSLVLLVAVELCSLHARSCDCADDVVGASLFADGAGACVISRDPGHWAIEQGASHLVPKTRDCMTWTISDEGFRMTLAARLPGVIAAHIRPWVESALASQQLKPKDVGAWVIHPGGPRIVEAVRRGVGLSGDQVALSLSVLRQYGNMSSPTVLFQLQKLIKEGNRGFIVMLGFGPGLTCEMLILRPGK